MLRLPSTRRLAMLPAVVLVVTATATAVPASAEDASPAATGYGFQTVAQDPTAPITVWVDADRTPITAAFQTDHPECPLNVESYDASAGAAARSTPRSRSSIRRAKAGPTSRGPGR